MRRLSPSVIAWSIAAAAGMGILTWMLRGHEESPPEPARLAEDSGEKPEIPLVPPEKEHAGPQAAGAPPWAAADDDDGRQRLEKLGLRLRMYEEQFSEFPQGTVTSDPQKRSHWSWLARLEEQRRPNLAARATESIVGWTDPSHERFVRRRVPEYLNPQLTAAVGERGYPTSHFVGMAGVGRDAAHLPATHSRAGVFRARSATRIDDIRDGLSQTMAVAGAEAQLGSWAEGGSATMRALTAEPYIHGPDGLGTGSADQMWVLMADGSVRTVTTAIDPRLVRRMAAMADGLPLDPQVPGEPGDPSVSPPSQLPRAVAQNPPDHPAVSALVALRPSVLGTPRPAAGVVLRQSLARFETTQPVSRRELFSLIEDLFHRPVRYSDAELGPLADRLDEPVRIEARGISVEDLLGKILQDTSLEFTVEADEIRIKRIGGASAPD